MGIFGKIGTAFKIIDYHISDDPEVVGKWFEDEVLKLFPTKYFKIMKKLIHLKRTLIGLLKAVKTRILFLNIFQLKNDLQLNVNSEQNYIKKDSWNGRIQHNLSDIRNLPCNIKFPFLL